MSDELINTIIRISWSMGIILFFVPLVQMISNKKTTRTDTEVKNNTECYIVPWLFSFILMTLGHVPYGDRLPSMFSILLNAAMLLYLLIGFCVTHTFGVKATISWTRTLKGADTEAQEEPNEETQAAMAELDEGKGTVYTGSTEDFFKDLSGPDHDAQAVTDTVNETGDTNE